MLHKILALSALATLALAQKHGEGAEGTSMGPVAFMWPEDRPWSAAEDNKGPCGSKSSVGNRTDFPLSGGSVALAIADDAYHVAFRIAYDSNPTTQSQFKTLIPSAVDEIQPGHQCYRVPTIPGDVAEGTKATIQMEYWSNDSGKDESFFACADINFVAVKNFKSQIPCFNVTADEFEAPAGTPTPVSVIKPKADTGLTNGEKAGIAVGSILGAASILGLAIFFGLRKRRTGGDHEAAPAMAGKAASVVSQ